MIINFDYIFSDGLVSYVKKSFSPGTVDAEGNYSDGAASYETINATPLQPINMDELKKLPDGEHVYSSVRFYTSASINNGDIIEDGLNNYEVMQVENRQSYSKVYLKLL